MAGRQAAGVVVRRVRRCGVERRARRSLALLAFVITEPAFAVADPHGTLQHAEDLAAAEPVDDSPRLSPPELRKLYPDLNMRESLPALFLAPQFGMHIPYQLLGVGLGLDLYPAPWLRLSALYSFGFSPTRNGATGSSYAEAAVGVRVYGADSQTALDLTSRAIPYADPVTVKAFVPSYHALFVEGGSMTGFFSSATCTANCDTSLGFQPELASDNHQFVLPFAGLRYVYFYQAASEHAHFRRREYLQVYVHAIGAAFNAPHHDMWAWNGERLDHNPAGARFGVELPPPRFCVADLVLGTGCAQGGFALGYSPTPGFIFFELHISYLVD
jgi:hypothetical protein